MNVLTSKENAVLLEPDTTTPCVYDATVAAGNKIAAPATVTTVDPMGKTDKAYTTLVCRLRWLATEHAEDVDIVLDLTV